MKKFPHIHKGIYAFSKTKKMMGFITEIVGARVLKFNFTRSGLVHLRAISQRAPNLQFGEVN